MWQALHFHCPVVLHCTGKKYMLPGVPDMFVVDSYSLFLTSSCYSHRNFYLSGMANFKLFCYTFNKVERLLLNDSYGSHLMTNRNEVIEL